MKAERSELEGKEEVENGIFAILSSWRLNSSYSPLCALARLLPLSPVHRQR